MAGFSEVKATQAAARFLKASGGTMNYLGLVKLMYLMDRSSLLKRGTPVLEDEYYCLPLGPVQSHVLSLASGPGWAADGFWAAHIMRDDRTITLQSDPGENQLSVGEQKVIDSVWKEFGKMGASRLVDYVHALPEYTAPPEGSRLPLSLGDILRKSGEKTPEQAAAIEATLESIRESDALFSR